jgi:hypothetical protein
VAAVAPREEPDEVVRTAQEKMRALIHTAEVTGDPSAPVLQGLAGLLSAMHALTSNVGVQIEAARQPIANEDLNRLSAAAARGASQHTMQLARSANRLTITVGLLGSLALLAVAYGVGSWLGWRSGFNEGNRLGLAANTTLATLPSEEAVVWARLIRDNPTVAEAMQSCRKNVATQNGRAMCSLPVWIEPLLPPNSVR